MEKMKKMKKMEKVKNNKIKVTHKKSNFRVSKSSSKSTI